MSSPAASHHRAYRPVDPPDPPAPLSLARASRESPRSPRRTQYALGALALTEAALLVAASLPSPPARILSAAAPLSLSPYAFAGLALSLAGGALRVACHHALGRFFMWAVGLHASHSLVTSGPYAIVRHPAYTGYFLMIFGPAVLCFDRGSLFAASGLGRTFLGRAAGVVCLLHIAAVSVGMVGRTKQEDEMLREEFGEEWEAWAKRTPYRLIPYVW